MGVRRRESRTSGGARVLSGRCRILGRASRLRCARPPFGSPERVAALSLAPVSEEFITGNGFASRCRYVLNFDILRVNEAVENNWWFCKADYLEYFFARHAPREPYVLFTHNSDRSIDGRFRRHLDTSQLVAWFAQNPVLEHPKLHALPIGIANPVWPHGDQDSFRRVRETRPEKTALFDVSFDTQTRPSERLRCLVQTGLVKSPRVAFPDFLRRLAAAYFCLSPRGNGVDSHRTWEALYLGTIPVVTRSVLTEQHRDIPMVALDDWADFRSIEFTPELYERTWDGWDPDEIRLDRYIERVEATIARAQR